VIRWEAPGPYEIAFSTRTGGVSEGPFESLNLTHGAAWWKFRDAEENVAENRSRVCRAIGADPARLTVNIQRHTSIVHRAEPGRRETGDALWTDEPETPMLALGADCALVALVRTNGDRPAAAVVHAGRIGILAGVLEAAAGTLGGRVAAVIGPTIGPCCYEVGEDVAGPYRERFGGGVVSGGRLDLPTAAERVLREAGCVSVERFDLCTSCRADLFFSYRRDGTPRGGHGVIARVVG
jgi:purine-nucleoside/S-methyl-5'-thioadenosine phosphorylase / adenosine deaminase